MVEDLFNANGTNDQEALGVILSTSAAFHRWKQAKLKTSFTRQLSGILEDVVAEERAKKRLEQAVERAHAREGELLQHISDLKAELNTAASQHEQHREEIQELRAALQAMETKAANLRHQSATAEAAHAAAISQADVMQQQHQRELNEVKQELQESLQQQQRLLDSLSQRDRQVSALAAELKKAQTAAADALQQMQHMEGVVQATGEKAASAEDGLRTSNELVIRLQQQLADLSGRYHDDLANLQNLHKAATESAALRDRLAESSTTAAALAAAHDEMRNRLDAANTALAAAAEENRQLRKAAETQKTLYAAGSSEELGSVFSQQLDDAQAQAVAIAPRLAAAEASLQQQQRHIHQLIAELEQTKQAQVQALERGEVLQVLNVQLQAENTYLAALSGKTGSSILRGTDDMIQDGQKPQEPELPALSMAMLLSQLQESLYNLESTKRSMARSKPKVIAAARHAAVATATVAEASVQLQELLMTLRTDQQEQDKEAAVMLAAAQSTKQRVEELLGQQAAQQHSVLEELQAKLQQEQQHWAQVLEGVAAVQTSLQDLQQQWQGSHVCDINAERDLCTSTTAEATIATLQQAEGQLAKALTHDLSANTQNICSPHTPADDQTYTDGSTRSSRTFSADDIFVAADVAARDVIITLLELIRLVGDNKERVTCGSDAALWNGSELDGATVSGRLCIAATRAAEKYKVIHSCYLSVSSSLAELASISAYLHTARQQGAAVAQQLKQLEGCFAGQQQQAKQRTAAPWSHKGSSKRNQVEDRTEEVAALQLEVAALRLQLQRRETEVQELLAREKQLLSGTSELVPVDLLTAAKNTQDELATTVAALQQQLVQQAAAQQVAADAYVERVVAKQTANLLAESWLRWRAATLEARAVQLCSKLEEAHAVLGSAAESQQRRSAALAVLFKRQARAAAQVEEEATAAAVVAAWQRQAARQVKATWHWRGLAELALQRQARQNWAAAAQKQQPSWIQSSFLQSKQQQQLSADLRQGISIETCEHFSLQECARKGTSVLGGNDEYSFVHAIRLRRQHPGSCLASVRYSQLLSLVFSVWRCWAQLQRKMRLVQQKHDYVEQLSSGLPAWVQLLGDKRRLERGWLAWRLAAVAAAVKTKTRHQEATAAAATEPQHCQAAECDLTARQPAKAAAAASIFRPPAAVSISQLDREKDAPEQPRWQLIGSPVADREQTLLSSEVKMAATSLPGHQAAWADMTPTTASIAAPAATAASSHGQHDESQGGRGASIDWDSRDAECAAAAVSAAYPAAAASDARAQTTEVAAFAAQQQQVDKLQEQRQSSATLQLHEPQHPHAEPPTRQAAATELGPAAPQASAASPATAYVHSLLPVPEMYGSLPQHMLMHKQRHQHLNLRGGTSNKVDDLNALTAVLRGKSPPAGLPYKTKAAQVAALSLTDNSDQTRPRSTSPGHTVSAAVGRHTARKAAFGRTLREGAWTPAAAAAGRKGAAPVAASTDLDSAQVHRMRRVQGKAAVAGLPTRSQGSGVLKASSAADEPQQHQVASAAGSRGVPVTSRVYDDLAAITSSLAAMQQQVQVRSRAIFQAGADALHPAACTVDATTLPHWQQLNKGTSSNHLAAAAAAAEGGAGQLKSDLQQQLSGCQQHLQQITSNLHLASRPWLYSPAKQLNTAIQHAIADTALSPIRSAADNVSSSPRSAAAAIQNKQSPAVLIDARPVQVMPAEQIPVKQAPAIDTNLAAAATGPVSRWHVVGQPHKAVVKTSSASLAAGEEKHDCFELAAVPEELHAVPITTYVCSHSPTPGPSSPQPNRAQQQTQPLDISGAAAGSKVSGIHSVACVKKDSSSTAGPTPAVCPVPQLASAVPQPYRSAVLQQGIMRPRASQQQQQQSRLPTEGNIAAVARGCEPGEDSLGVVRFARIKGHTSACQAPGAL